MSPKQDIFMVGDLSYFLANSTVLRATVLQTETADRQKNHNTLSANQIGVSNSFLIAEANNVRDIEDNLQQMTAVNQLSDVAPTDWAYQSLKSLTERYRCISGYFDTTFQGHRSITRFEMAAALDACLNQLGSQLIEQDLVVIERLQAEFKAELMTLKSRVDMLEVQGATLEAQQFSTMTKLQGKATFIGQFGGILGKNLINPTTGQPVSVGSLRPNVLSSVNLAFNTSFRGSDLLQISIAAGNGGQDAFTDLGLLNYPDASDNAGKTTFAPLGTNALAGFPSKFYLYRLAYTFKPVQNLSLTIGPQIYPADFLDFNTYSNNYYSDFSSYVFINNPLTMPFTLNFLGGAGGALDWKISEPLSIRAAFAAASATNAIANTDGGGLLGDPYQATLELEYYKNFGKNASNNFTARLQYTNSATNNVSQNAIGLNLEATLGQIGLFGRFGYSIANAYGASISPLADQGFNALAWTGGIAVKDLLFSGSLLAAAMGQPFINNLPATLTFGPNTATQTNYEAFFRIPISEQISVTPGVMIITEPNNTAGQPSLIQGYIRTTFSF